MFLVPWRHKDNQWNPFKELESIQEQVNRILHPLTRSSESTPEFYEGAWTPAIDVKETKSDFLIKADIPGLNKDDLKVSVENDILTIRGERKSENETEENGVIRKERVYGSFFRSLSLPQSVAADEVKASYKNGVLELTLPKKEEAKPKQISVKID